MDTSKNLGLDNYCSNGLPEGAAPSAYLGWRRFNSNQPRDDRTLKVYTLTALGALLKFLLSVFVFLEVNLPFNRTRSLRFMGPFHNQGLLLVERLGLPHLQQKLLHVLMEAGVTEVSPPLPGSLRHALVVCFVLDAFPCFWAFVLVVVRNRLVFPCHVPPYCRGNPLMEACNNSPNPAESALEVYRFMAKEWLGLNSSDSMMMDSLHEGMFCH